VEGSVLRSGNRVRIAAHMIYAPTDQNATIHYHHAYYSAWTVAIM